MLKTLLERLRWRLPETEELAAGRRSLWSRDATFPPWSPDDLVRRRGLEIYDRMQTDSQISACLTTKKFAVLADGWSVTGTSPDPGDQEAARFCRWALSEMRTSVQDVLFCVMDALAKGYSISEMNFRRVKEGPYRGLVTLDSIKHKDPALFDFRTDEYLNVTGLVRLGSDGEPERDLPREKFVIYTYMPAYEDPRGRSDLRPCYRHWWVKDVVQRFLAIHLERHGSPVVKGTYRRGTTRQQQEELLRVLEGIRQETAIVVPEDVTVELMEAASRGEQGYLETLCYHDRQIAKAILGETLTQEEGSRTGALALARVHQDTLRHRVNKVRRDLEETVMRSQVLRALTVLNFPGAAVPRFSLEGAGGETSIQDRRSDV